MKLNKKKVMKYLQEAYPKRIKKEQKSRGRSGNDIVERAADELIDLNNAIERGDRVFCVCTYCPDNWDKCSHQYQVYYPTKRKTYENKQVLDLVRVFIPFLMDKNKKGEYCWKSNAFGMSRIIDATDHIFKIIKNCGGTYIQLNDCL